MTATAERIYTMEAGELALIEAAMNDFIKTKVSKVVDLEIKQMTRSIGYYAYIRYIPT